MQAEGINRRQQGCGKELTAQLSEEGDAGTQEGKVLDQTGMGRVICVEGFWGLQTCVNRERGD